MPTNINFNIINNPLTYYKLDPGEPGIAPPTPASHSAFTVFAQEARNRHRLQAEALMEGKEVVFLNTEYKVRKNGSFLTMVGGTTTIITREKQKTNENPGINEVDNTQKRDVPNESDLNSSSVDPEEYRLRAEQAQLKRLLRTANPEQKRKIEARLREIETRLKQIEQKKKRDTNQNIADPNTAFIISNWSRFLNNPATQLLDLLG